MTMAETLDDYGVLTAPLTLQIQRVLPGPAERVWDYLTRSELRRQWLASGDMELREGAAFTLTWRNEHLPNAGRRPEGSPEEHSMESRILEADPPRKLVFAWMQGEVSFELEPSGDKVVLTVTHKRVSDHSNLLKVSAGWHAHLDVLSATLEGRAPPPFWAQWAKLHEEYAARLGG